MENGFSFSEIKYIANGDSFQLFDKSGKVSCKRDNIINPEIMVYIHYLVFNKYTNMYFSVNGNIDYRDKEWGISTKKEFSSIKESHKHIIWLSPKLGSKLPAIAIYCNESIKIELKKIRTEDNSWFSEKTEKQFGVSSRSKTPDKPLGKLSNSTCLILLHTRKENNKNIEWLYFFPQSENDVDLVFNFIESLPDFGLISNKPIENNSILAIEEEINDNRISSEIDLDSMEQKVETDVAKDEFEINEINFENEVSIACKLSQEERNSKLNSYPEIPTQSTVTHQVFNRNPYVVAEVLLRANGICEKCNSKAPFLRDSDGTPYLEVHHKTPLSEGGCDTVENSHALCPNCHRHAHYGKNTYIIK